MVGSDVFPSGFRPIFRCELAVSFREGNHLILGKYTHDLKPRVFGQKHPGGWVDLGLGISEPTEKNPRPSSAKALKRIPLTNPGGPEVEEAGSFFIVSFLFRIKRVKEADDFCGFKSLLRLFLLLLYLWKFAICRNIFQTVSNHQLEKSPRIFSPQKNHWKTATTMTRPPNLKIVARNLLGEFFRLFC